MAPTHRGHATQARRGIGGVERGRWDRDIATADLSRCGQTRSFSNVRRIYAVPGCGAECSIFAAWAAERGWGPGGRRLHARRRRVAPGPYPRSARAPRGFDKVRGHARSAAAAPRENGRFGSRPSSSALRPRARVPARNLGDVPRLLPEPGNPRWRQGLADGIGFVLRAR